MIFQKDSNYYDILEIRPDASAQDVRNAYMRLKTSYRKDNPALYSILDASETEDWMGKIEEAFQILSDPDSRRDYDDRNGFADRVERKIFSVDRSSPTGLAPPMDGGEDMDSLFSPSTEFEGMVQKGEQTPARFPSFSLPSQAPSSFPERPSVPAANAGERKESPFSNPGLVERRQAAPAKAEAPGDPVLQEIANETEWRGPTLRRLRELRRYSLDDVASLTKISRTYLIAIEEEAFAKLPAPVFVRGFLLQFARTLKIPAEPLAQAYMARLLKRGL